MKHNNHDKCLICGSSKLNKMNGFETAFLVKCSSCGLVFSEKIPTEMELIDHYNGYGRDDYLSDITISRYNELLDQFEKYRKTNRILDIGCGIGYFLEIAIQRGWKVYGTEFTKEAVKICKNKGINMNEGIMDPKNYEDDFFDIATSIEVIEHINNPKQEMSNIHRVLRPGGVFYFTTPNFNSLLRYRLKEEYNIITYPEHLTYYTPSTINKLMISESFTKVWLKTTGISLTRFRTSQSKSHQKFISEQSDDEKVRLKIEKNKGLQVIKNIVNSLLSILGTGDSLKGLYTKL